MHNKKDINGDLKVVNQLQSHLNRLQKILRAAQLHAKWLTVDIVT